MKANVTINFKKILGLKVDKSLLEKEPKLLETTKKTMEILCLQIKKYFQDNKIKVKCNFKLDNEN